MIDINVSAFNQRITDGQRELSLWPFAPWVTLALVIGLIVVGLRPRLAEYR